MITNLYLCVVDDVGVPMRVQIQNDEVATLATLEQGPPGVRTPVVTVRSKRGPARHYPMSAIAWIEETT